MRSTRKSNFFEEMLALYTKQPGTWAPLIRRQKTSRHFNTPAWDRTHSVAISVKELQQPADIVALLGSNMRQCVKDFKKDMRKQFAGPGLDDKDAYEALYGSLVESVPFYLENF